MTIVAMKQTEVLKRAPTGLGRPLKILVPLIQDELDQADVAGLQHYAQAGELLWEVRNGGQVAKFKWGAWLSKNFALSRSTAERYMRLAIVLRENPDLASRADATLRTLIGQTDGHETRTAWRKVAARVRAFDRELFAQTEQSEREEIRLHRALALELITLGYRTLAMRLHPDKGGSKDAMRRLTRVRDDLKTLANSRRFV